MAYKQKKLIVFICNGNMHRSVIAAEVLRKILKARKIGENFSVASYGLQGTKGTALPKYKHLSEYTKEWKATKPTLQKFSIDISKHRFQKISGAVMKRASVVIALDNKVYSTAKNSLMNQFPKKSNKFHLFSELTPHYKQVKDPLGSGDVRLHRDIIKTIYLSLNKNFKVILDWVR